MIILEHGMVVADGHPSELAVTHRDMLFGSSLGVSSKEENSESSKQRSPRRLRGRGLPTVPASLTVPKLTTSDKNKYGSVDLAPASSTSANTCNLGEIKVVLEHADIGDDDDNIIGGGDDNDDDGENELPENDESKALEGLLENMKAGGKDTTGTTTTINALSSSSILTGAAHATTTKTSGSSSSIVEPSGGVYVPLSTAVNTTDRSSDDRNEDRANSNNNNNNNNHSNPSRRTTRINRVVKQLVVTEARKAGSVSLAVYSKYFAAAMKMDIMESTSSAMYTMDSDAGTAALILTPIYIESSNITDQSSHHPNAPSSHICTSVETMKRKKAKIEDAAAKSNATKAEKRAQTMPQDLKCRINGWLIAVGLFLLFTASQVSRVAIDYSLAKWASVDAGDPKSFWALSYWVCIPVLIGFLCFRSVYLNIFAYLSAKQIHGAVFRAVICAPITTFYDTHTVRHTTTTRYTYVNTFLSVDAPLIQRYRYRIPLLCVCLLVLARMQVEMVVNFCVVLLILC